MRLISLLKCLLVLLILGTVLGWLGRFFWVFDLPNHFTAQFAVLFGLLTLVFTFSRRVGAALIAAAFTLLHASAVFPLFMVDPPSRSGKPVAHLRVLQYNVHYKTKDQAPLAKFIRETHPDIIGLEEFTPSNREGLEAFPIMKQYPYRLVDGIESAIYSRTPITPVNLNLRKTIAGNITLKGQRISIVVTHTPVPVFRFAKMQKALFAKLIARQNRLEPRFIVLGDFNSTPWSSNFQDFVHGMHAKNSMQGFGTQPSWPSLYGGPYIPIDHCLMRGPFVATNRFIGPALGSDHQPVVVDMDLVGPLHTASHKTPN